MLIIAKVISNKIKSFFARVVGDWMFLGTQDFDFCPNLTKCYPNFTKFTQILSDLSKFNQILSKFAEIWLKCA